MTDDTERLIEEIFIYANKMREEFNLSDEWVEVQSTAYLGWWHITVSPSFLSLNKKDATIMRRGYSSKVSLRDALDQAYNGTRDEWNLIQDGKVRSV